MEIKYDPLFTPKKQLRHFIVQTVALNEMIDKKTGFIELALDKIIKPNMPYNEIKNWEIGLSQTEMDMGNGWKWLDVRNVKITGFTLLFLLVLIVIN